MRSRYFFAPPIVLLCLISTPLRALDITGQFDMMSRPIKGPIDALYQTLGVFQINCFMKVAIFRLEPTAQNVSNVEECIKNNLAHGNESILKARTTFPTPNAQAALKELAFYWRGQMTPTNLLHSDEEEIEILKLLKGYTERVRLEADW
jgi:hypothetical protein